MTIKLMAVFGWGALTLIDLACTVGDIAMRKPWGIAISGIATVMCAFLTGTALRALHE